MFKIFKYKSMYKKEHQNYLDLLNIKNQISKDYIEENKSFREKILDLEQQIVKLHKDVQSREKMNKKLMEEINEYIVLLATANAEIEHKEKQRRQNAGKIGALVTCRNKMLAEKQEMLDLIDRLLLEMKKLSKEKKKPTLEELRKYFKIGY